MKNIFKIVFVTLLASTYGCEKFLDVNENQDSVRAVGMELQLPGAQASMAGTFGGSYHNLGSFWAQYSTQSPDAGQYEDMDAYRVTTDEFDREWSEVYTGALENLRNIKDEANEKGATNYALVATLCESFTFQMLADLYNEVPFSEALMGAENTTPKFDNGAEIYPAIISQINAAVAAYEANPSTNDMSAADIIYGGDMEQWIKFANTLKLKMYMRQSYTSAPKGAEIMALLAEDNFITADATMSSFGSGEGQRNPYYEVQVDRLGDVNNRASNTMIKFLMDSLPVDDRLDALYIAGGSAHLAKEQGDFANRDISANDLSTPFYEGTTPVYFMTIPELHFLKAEAMVRYAAGAGAQAEYEAGIDASFAMHGLSTSSNFYGAGNKYEYKATGNVETDIAQIMMQKWVAMCNTQNLEAFFEVNRTQQPPLSENPNGTPGNIGERTLSYASVLSGRSTPRRLSVPDVEVVRNKNAPSQPANGLATKVWWDKK